MTSAGVADGDDAPVTQDKEPVQLVGDDAEFGVGEVGRVLTGVCQLKTKFS